MLWIERLEQAPTRLAGPLAWVAPHAEAAGWRLPSPTAADLADAALARRDGGAPRLLRRRMLRTLLGQLFGRRPDSFAFSRSEAGAPRVEGLGDFISTSGCDGWSAVAVGPRPLGVDIETGDDPELERWVLAEAYGKALGRGLLEPLPLEGGGARVGVRAMQWKRMAHEAAPPRVELLKPPALTPIPALPLSRRKGSRCWTRRVGPQTLAGVVELMNENAAPLG